MVRKCLLELVSFHQYPIWVHALHLVVTTLQSDLILNISSTFFLFLFFFLRPGGCSVEFPTSGFLKIIFFPLSAVQLVSLPPLLPVHLARSHIPVYLGMSCLFTPVVLA